MVEEKREEGVEDPIKMFLAEALVQQRNEMSENCSQILQIFPTIAGAPSSRSFFEDAIPFKVQVNFNIPIFEYHIDADDLEKCLNILEGYFFVHNFSDK
jgi:hypothetical protein